jgi:cobalt/nickel transport protein
MSGGLYVLIDPDSLGALLMQFFLRLAIPLSVCLLPATASAHFHMLFPETGGKSGKKFDFVYRWGHPFEHEMFDAARPDNVLVLDPDGKPIQVKLNDLKEFKLENCTAYRIPVEIPQGAKAGGDFLIAVTAPEIFDKDSAVILADTVKVILHVDIQKGWDQVTGVPFELVPMTRPYGLEPGMVFQAQTLHKGKPLAGAVVEVERLNAKPPKESDLPPDEYRTRVVKTDPNGVLTCTLTDPGWWCITAYRDGGKAKHDGKMYPLQERTTLWVHVDAKR